MFVSGKVTGWRHFPSTSPRTRPAIEFGASFLGLSLPPPPPTLPIVKSEAKIIYEHFSHETWQPRLALHFGINICVQGIVAWEGRTDQCFFLPILWSCWTGDHPWDIYHPNRKRIDPIGARAVLYQLSYIPYTPKLGDIQNMKVGNLQHPFIFQAIEVNLFSQNRVF